MKNAPAEQRSSAVLPHSGPRREWVKPEVKTAEVAQATLAGSTTAPLTDVTTCAS
jgi:hypothetical protein